MTRPPGYREPTDEEMKCLPEGSLYDSATGWRLSEQCGQAPKAPKEFLAVPLGGWQPIETAPKDGTSIQLGWDYLQTIGQARWEVEGEYADWYAEDNDGCTFYTKPPTHWQPLPKPPVYDPPPKHKSL